jgi:hypothetical protein
MKHIIDLKKVKLLFHTDWVEQRVVFYHYVGTLTTIMILFFVLISWMNPNYEGIREQYILYILGIAGTMVTFCHYVGEKVHRPRGLFLSLPANTIEKYAVLLIEGGMVVVLFHLISGFGCYVYHLYDNSFRILSIPYILNAFPLSFMAFIFSSVLLSYILFRRYALPIVVGFYVLLLLCFSILENVLRIHNFTDIGMIVARLNGFTIRLWDIFFYIAALVCMYFTYLKLKTKEIK